MRPIGKLAFGSGAFGVALAAGTALCSAQTTVTRQVTTEPVETTVTQSSSGIIVTRRVLDPTVDPGAPPFVAGPVRYPPLAAGTIAGDTYVEPAPAVTIGQRVTPRRVVTKRPAPTRSQARVEPQRPTTTGLAPRTVVRSVAPPPDQTLVLSPAQRQVVYRTIVHRDVYPVPVAPPPVAGYPLRTVYPAGDDYGYRNSGYRDYAYRDEGYRQRYPYRWDGVALVAGARLPASISLVAIPDSVVADVPTLAPYSYAYVDDRVYLVDPATGIIAAEITP